MQDHSAQNPDGESRGTAPSASEQAFASGADLWIVAEPEESAWARRIDWYLNFQIARAREHQSQTLPEALQSIMAREELDAVPTPQTPNHLLVSSARLLPNHAVAVISAKDLRLAQWVEQTYRVWSAMDEPSLRVFVPDRFRAREFREAWKGTAAEVSVIENDSESAR